MTIGEFFKENQWTIVLVVAILGVISGIINTFLGKKGKNDPSGETFKVVSEKLTRPRKGGSGRYSKAADSDIYQKEMEKVEEDHVL